MPSSIAFRLGLVIAAIVTATALLTATLNYFKFQRAIERQEASLHAFIVDDVVSSVETAMDLGLPLNALTNIDRLLDRRRARYQHVLSIDIFDNAGRLLVRSGSGAAPGEGIDHAALARRAEAGASWFDVGRDAYAIGAPIRSSYGKVMGGVLLRYDREATDRRGATVMFSLAETSLIAAAAGALVAILGAALISRPTRRELRSLAARLAASAGARDHPPEGEPSHPVEIATRETYRRLTEAEAAIEALSPSAAGRP